MQRRWPGFFLVSAAAIWIGAVFLLRPDFIFSQTYLWGDGGHTLVVCQQLLNGKLFFRDIYSQYGPLPSYAYAGVAALYGNSVKTYLLMVSLLTIVNVWLIYCLLRRNVSAINILLLCFAAIFPVFLLPGSFTQGYPETIYYGFERAALIVAVMLWRPSINNSYRHAFLLGLSLGALQTIKFGGAFVLGLAIVAIDLCFLFRAGATRAAMLRWAKINAAIFLGFLAIEAILAIVALSLMPWAMAKDFLWPTYMLANYSSYVTSATRGFAWMGLRFFVARQLGPGCALLFAGAAVIRLFSTTKLAPSQPDAFIGRLLIFACFYLIGLPLYFKQTWLIYAYVWTLLISAAWGFERTNWWGRGALLAACLPCFWVNIKSLSPDQRPADVNFHVVAPEIGLWLTPQEINRVESLRTAMRQFQASRSQFQQGIIIVPEGGGLHVAYNLPPATRHTWFMVGAIQSYDEDDFISALNRCCAIVYLADESTPSGPPLNPSLWPITLRGTPFPEDLGSSIAQRLMSPIRINEGCWLFPVKEVTASSNHRGTP